MSDLVGKPEDRFSQNEAHIEEARTKMVRLNLKSLWHGQENSARDSKMNKEKKTEEEVGRQHKELDKTGV